MNTVNLTVNGKSVSANIQPRTHLADFLRETQNLSHPCPSESSVAKPLLRPSRLYDHALRQSLTTLVSRRLGISLLFYFIIDRTSYFFL